MQVDGKREGRKEGGNTKRWSTKEMKKDNEK